MGPLDLLCDGMIAYSEGKPKRIQHFLKVHSLARLIAVSEGIDAHTRFILEAAGYVRNAGIQSAQAKEILEELYFPQDVVDRVMVLVNRHHTDTGVDGADSQILAEAECLVKLCEENAGESAAWSAGRRVFRTESGKRLLKLVFGMKDD